MAAAQSLPGQTPLPPGTSKPSPWRRSLAEAVASHVVGTQPPVEVKAGAVQVGHTILAPSPCPRPTHRVPCLGLSLDLLSTHGEWCTFMKDEPELEVPSDARRPPHSKAGRRTPPCAPRSPTARQCQVWGGAVCLLSDHGAPRSSGTAPAPPTDAASEDTSRFLSSLLWVLFPSSRPVKKCFPGEKALKSVSDQTGGAAPSTLAGLACGLPGAGNEPQRQMLWVLRDSGVTRVVPPGHPTETTASGQARATAQPGPGAARRRPLLGPAHVPDGRPAGLPPPTTRRAPRGTLPGWS